MNCWEETDVDLLKSFYRHECSISIKKNLISTVNKKESSLLELFSHGHIVLLGNRKVLNSESAFKLEEQCRICTGGMDERKVPCYIFLYGQKGIDSVKDEISANKLIRGHMILIFLLGITLIIILNSLKVLITPLLDCVYLNYTLQGDICLLRTKSHMFKAYINM